jgi:hypothetical protein
MENDYTREEVKTRNTEGLFCSLGSFTLVVFVLLEFDRYRLILSLSLSLSTKMYSGFVFEERKNEREDDNRKDKNFNRSNNLRLEENRKCK